MPILLLTLLIQAATLPGGHEAATWGMTVDRLLASVNAKKVHPGDGFNYAEHLEETPDVYFRTNNQHERIEYYFYQGRLYKIFIIYDKILYRTGFYDGLVQNIKTRYGSPHTIYEERLFDLLVHHTLWEDGTSNLDLRKGAGFIYQVRSDKAIAEKKARSQKKRKGI